MGVTGAADGGRDPRGSVHDVVPGEPKDSVSRGHEPVVAGAVGLLVEALTVGDG